MYGKMTRDLCHCKQNVTLQKEATWKKKPAFELNKNRTTFYSSIYIWYKPQMRPLMLSPLSITSENCPNMTKIILWFYDYFMKSRA